MRNLNFTVRNIVRVDETAGADEPVLSLLQLVAPRPHNGLPL